MKDRIKKLRALAESTEYEYEAKLALEIAERLERETTKVYVGPHRAIRVYKKEIELWQPKRE